MLNIKTGKMLSDSKASSEDDVYAEGENLYEIIAKRDAHLNIILRPETKY